jgi:hypothetical protein
MLVFMLQHNSYAGSDVIRVPTGMACIARHYLEHQGRYMRSLTPYKSNPSLSLSHFVSINPYSRRWPDHYHNLISFLLAFSPG